jgi:lysophospholipase L1-like esterase
LFKGYLKKKMVDGISAEKKSPVKLAPVLLVLFFVFCSFSSLFAQKKDFNYSIENSSFEFIRYDSNEIVLHGPQAGWNKLFGRFEKLAFEGTGEISVVHIGGSHVQAGFLTDKMRYNFTRIMYGAEGERGFVFPFDLAKSNSPKSIQCKWTGDWTGQRNSVKADTAVWGVSGFNAITKSPQSSVTLSVLNYDSVAYTFSKVKLYFNATSNINIEGDSLNIWTELSYCGKGCVEIELSRPTQVFQLNIISTDTMPCLFSLQGFYLEQEQSGIIYNAIGVNGANSGSFLRCALLPDQLKTIYPDLVILGIGVNDANVPPDQFNAQAYETKYDSLIRTIIAVNPETCFLFLNNNDTYIGGTTPNTNIYRVRDVINKLADRYNGGVYDFFSVMGGLGSIKKWEEQKLAATDKIHLTKKGYELQADLIAIAFRNSLGNYLDKKRN